MRSTCKRLGKVATGTSGDSPKKQGKQPPASSWDKCKATTTSSQPTSTDVAAATATAEISTENAITAVAAISVGSVDANVAKNNANNGDAISSTTSQPASMDVDAIVIAVAVAMDISTENTITAVAAVSVGGVDDNVAKNNANNGDAISSLQCRGKKQKQGTLSKPATPTNQSSPSPKKYKQPRPIVCFWKHCPFPTIGQMTVLCSEEGCSKSMYQQCLYEFEHAINYDHFTGKVEDTHYCPEHHPKKHLIDGEDGSDTDACNEDVREREMQAAFKIMQPLVPRLPLLPLLPPQPLPAVTNKCDWWNCLTGCICPELPGASPLLEFLA
jgi:hypothetical protein